MDGTRLYSIVQEISKTSQGNDSVSVYYMKLKLLWDQYAEVKTGTRCNCSASVNHLADENNLKLMHFLMGLNEKYTAVRSNILMTSLLPSVMTAFNIVSQEESYKSLSSRIGSEKVDKPSAVFAVNKTFKKSKAKNLNLKCNHYGGQGHLVERCFKLIGYPEKRDNSKFKTNRFVNNVEGIDQNKYENIQSVQSKTVLTLAVVEQFLKLVNVQHSEGSSKVNMAGVCASTLSGSKFSNNWVVDSGATDHMVHNLDMLTEITAVSGKSLTVNLSNGANLNVMLVGKCFLTKDVLLENVFYVPSFRFNLLSVSRVTQSSKVGVTFVNNICPIQDLLSGATLGTGELVDSLYCFTGSSGLACTIYSGNYVNSTLWHNRFGHPPNVALNPLKSVLKLSDFDASGSCEVFHKAKQGRELFSLSSHKSSAFFIMFMLTFGDLTVWKVMMGVNIFLLLLMTTLELLGFLK